MRWLALALFACIAAIACGETRKGPGEECLRGDDCLSGFCAARVCVSAPPVGTPQTIPDDAGDATTNEGGSASDAGAADAPAG